ncbi:hypothetical protein SK3146_00880 [Paenibacillus konkukensis]|uniref:Uncharacterized protein n=1 Tax=Paenibacillus konkukensis TaxID=2020716 RepID=A0ABY4RJC6_9BACL|nr:hypothetical protein SK3146_00880 [Paenibacillus konkukensis]
MALNGNHNMFDNAFPIDLRKQRLYGLPAHFLIILLDKMNIRQTDFVKGCHFCFVQ